MYGKAIAKAFLFLFAMILISDHYLSFEWTMVVIMVTMIGMIGLAANTRKERQR